MVIGSPGVVVLDSRPASLRLGDHGEVSPVPDAAVWIAVAAALIQVAVVVHVGRGRETGGRGPHRSVPDTVFVLGMAVAVFVELRIILEDAASENAQGHNPIGALSPFLDTTLFKWVLVIFALASMLIRILWAWVIGAVIKSLVAGNLDRVQVLAHIATLVTTATAGVLLIGVDHRSFARDLIIWVPIVLGFIGGLLEPVEVPAGQPRDDNRRPVGGQARQSPGRGLALTVVGWTLFALSLLMPMILIPWIDFQLYESRDPVSDVPIWMSAMIAFAVIAPGFLLFGIGNVLLKKGKQLRHRIIPSFEELAGERYLLYLRPFSLDPVMALPPGDDPSLSAGSPFELVGTYEEFLVSQFQGLGRIVAIGQPGEPLPELGAERGYLPRDDDWKDTASRLIKGAHAVIITAAPGSGTMWEFTEALHATTPTRLLLLVYDDETYRSFREGVAQEYATRSSAEADLDWPPLPQLPDVPPPPARARGVRWEFPLRGILSFDHEWRPQFTRFPPTLPRIRHAWTIRRLVRRELKPVLDPVSQLPPAPPLERCR
ncbi:hypothetical protein LZ318_19130 [Saccharopolyspora indica]|uniref:hypothetical protein n=1 Tax=Saccharopolyspora indica TaxID=1229659 RepID=UPI0022EB18F4|nr:hypothetical protein [Saccharopolyspora indica]MDA3645400.1 hypothetical protein [Saccharopolyspora indica]